MSRSSALNEGSTDRVWQNGPAVPLTTPFLATEGNAVDHPSLAKQVVRCAKAGLGIVLLGTTGEGGSTFLQPSSKLLLKPCFSFFSRGLELIDWDSEPFEPKREEGMCTDR